MIKAKALCRAESDILDEVRPLEALQEKPDKETGRFKELDGLIAGMQNMIIESAAEGEDVPEAVTDLAVSMMDHNNILNDILPQIRHNYIQRKKEFHISVAGKTAAEREELLKIFQDMTGLVSSVHYCQGSGFVSGSMLLTPKAQRFLTGRYLELAVYEAVRKSMEQLAGQYRTDYRIYRNVQVATTEGTLKNEFDVVICCNGIFYVVECKSGKNFCDFGRFVEIGRTYGIIPDRLLLVDSYISDRQAECIEYWCEYFVCNLKGGADGLCQKVVRMISKDLNNERSAAI